MGQFKVRSVAALDIPLGQRNKSTDNIKMCITVTNSKDVTCLNIRLRIT